MYPRLAEYGQIKDAPRSKVTVIDRRYVESKRREYRLEHGTAGYEPAGSIARWTDEYWAVRFDLDGARHGQVSRDEAKMRALFDKWTKSLTDEP